jgi:hypothetical protein
MPEDVEVLTTEEQELPNDIQAQLRIGRKAAKETEALQLQIKQMERQSAIERAGVPEHPAREVVFANYDGPLESESIRDYAKKMGIVQAPVTGEISVEEQAAQRAILSAGGGSPPSSGDVDLAVALRNAKSQAEVMAIVREVAGNPGFKSRDGLIGELPPPI